MKTPQKAQHTPFTEAPLDFEYTSKGENVIIGATSGMPLAEFFGEDDLASANAAHIVKCVNLYEELFNKIEELTKMTVFNDVAEINLHGHEVNDLFKLLARARGES